MSDDKVHDNASELIDRFEVVTREAMVKLHQSCVRQNELQKSVRKLRQENAVIVTPHSETSEQLKLKMIPLQATLRQAISRIDTMLSHGNGDDDG
jgi:hypothetical protein